MIESALNLLLLVIGVVCAVVWICGLANSDGAGTCRPEDCDICPFPHCTAEEKQKHILKENNHNERSTHHNT